MLFNVVAALFYILTKSAQGFQFLYILHNTCYFLFFLNSSHPNECVLICFFNFILSFFETKF